MRFVVALFVVILLGLPVRGDDAASEGHAKTIAPFVDNQTFLVIHIDVSRLNLDVVSKYMDADKMEREKFKAIATLAKTTFLRSGGKDVYVLFDWANSMNAPLIVAPMGRSAAPEAIAALVRQVPDFQAVVKNDVLVAGPKKALGRVGLQVQAPGIIALLDNFKPTPVPDLTKALAAVGEGTAQVVFLPPFALKRAFVEMFPTLPKEIGGGNSSVLDFQWAAARVDAEDKLAAKIVVQTAEAKAAQDIAKVLDRALDFAAKSPEVKRDIPQFAKMASLFVPKVQDDRLMLTWNNADITTVLLPLIEKQRQAASRATSMNNLKQIALAIHSYHDVNKSFPPAATYDAKGQPLLSWRVHILPYIEQDALYRQFKLDEPWDSEHNKKLLSQMPRTYASPAQKNLQEWKTTYLAPVGPKTIFEGKKGMPIQKITDGTSNTIMIVETDDSHAVYWTQPADYKVDAKDPLAGLVRPGAHGFHAAFADGSVHLLPNTLSPDTLRALYTANGGEPVTLP